MTKYTAGKLLALIHHGLQRSLKIAKCRDRHLRARKRFDLLVALLASMVVVLWSVTSFAQPTLEADCGTGATVVGSDTAGKITLGAGVTTCTLDFSSTFTNPPACIATDESENGGNPQPIGAKSTTTTVVIGGNRPIVAGDVVSYICAAY